VGGGDGDGAGSAPARGRGGAWEKMHWCQPLPQTGRVSGEPRPTGRPGVRARRSESDEASATPTRWAATGRVGGAGTAVSVPLRGALVRKHHTIAQTRT